MRDPRRHRLPVALLLGTGVLLAVVALSGRASRDTALAGEEAGAPPPPAAATRTVVGRIVRFEGREPLVGRRVRLVGLDAEGYDLRQDVLTDAAGAFRFGQVPADAVVRVWLCAEPGETTVVVGVDEAADAIADVGDLVVGGPRALTGDVVDETGSAIVGAQVVATPTHPDPAPYDVAVQASLLRLQAPPPPLARATTDEGGRFRFDDLAAADVDLEITAPGFASRSLPASLRSHPSGAQHIRVVLAIGTLVHGRVVDARGEGVPGALVGFEAGARDGALVGHVVREDLVRCDEEGRFRDLRAPGESADRMPVVLVFVPGQAVSRHVIAEGTAGDELVLQGAPPATVEVEVQEAASGAPLVGARVVLATHAPPGAWMSGQGSIASAVTGAQGTATLPVGAGRLEMLLVCQEGRIPGLWLGQVGGRSGALGLEVVGDVDVLAPGPGRLVVRMPTPSTIEGRVLDPQGAAVPGARVASIGQAGRQQDVATDADGRYLLSFVFHPGSGVPPGLRHLSLKASAPGLALATSEEHTDLPADSVTPIRLQQDLHLRPTVLLSGRVLDARGLPVAGARVQAMGMQAAAPAPVGSTDGEGAYHLEGPFDRFVLDVQVDHPDHLPAWAPVAWRPAAARLRADDVALEAGVDVTVPVVDADGRPLAGIVLHASGELPRAVTPAPRSTWSTTTDARGHARWQHVGDRHGALSIHVVDARLVEERILLPLEAPAPRPPLVLRRARVWRVEVVDGAGRPVPAAAVEGRFPFARVPQEALRAVEEERRVFASSAPSGVALLGRVPPTAPLHVRVRAAGYRPWSGDLDAGAKDPRVVLVAYPPETLERIAALEAELKAHETALHAALAERTGLTQDVDATREAHAAFHAHETRIRREIRRLQEGD